MIESGLTERQARQRLFMIDVDGLLIDGMQNLSPSQKPFARSLADVAGWARSPAGKIGLLQTVTNARLTALIGVSGQPSAFDEAIVRTMAAGPTGQ